MQTYDAHQVLDADECVDALYTDGIILIRNLFAPEEVFAYKQKALKLLERYRQTGGDTSSCGAVIAHPFSYDIDFIQPLSNQLIYEIISTAIGDTTVLINSSLNNRQLLNTYNSDQKNTFNLPGTLWHTDSRYVQKSCVKLPHGFGYIASICLDEFSHSNGSTQFVKGSHLSSIKPERNLDPQEHTITDLSCSSGDAFIFDCGLWHKAGTPGNKPRWSIFSFYAPWYVKPYYDFPKMLSVEQIKSLNDIQLKLFHLTSTPPKSELIRKNTVISPEEFRKSYF